jgi:hypothetical protein
MTDLNYAVCTHSLLKGLKGSVARGGNYNCRKTLSKNPVIFSDLLDSCHSFKRGIRDKISIKKSRMMPNGANCTNVRTRAHHHKIRVFSLEFPIVSCRRIRTMEAAHG